MAQSYPNWRLPRATESVVTLTGLGFWTASIGIAPVMEPEDFSGGGVCWAAVNETKSTKARPRRNGLNMAASRVAECGTPGDPRWNGLRRVPRRVPSQPGKSDMD